MCRFRNLFSLVVALMALSLALCGPAIAQESDEEDGSETYIIRLIPIDAPAFPGTDPRSGGSSSNGAGEPRAVPEYIDDVVASGDPPATEAEPDDPPSESEPAAPSPDVRTNLAVVHVLDVKRGEKSKSIPFTSQGYGGVELFLHPDAPGSVTARLYRILENGRRQDAGFGGMVNPGRSTSLAVEPGEYMWELDSLGAFEESVLQVALWFVEDPFEPNDQYRPRATSLGRVETMVLHARNDVEWFLIEVPAGGLRVSLDPDAPVAEIQAALYEVRENPFSGVSAGNEIDRVFSIPRGGSRTLSVFRAGLYLVAINHGGNGYSREDFRVAFTHIPDPYEPDSMAEPRAVRLGEAAPFVISSPKDRDYFAVDVRGTQVAASLRGDAAFEVLVSLYEMNPDNPFAPGRKVAERRLRSGAAGTFELPAPGRYIVSVENTAQAHGRETLFLTFDAP